MVTLCTAMSVQNDSMNKDKPNKMSHCLIERAVEKLLNDEKAEQQSATPANNIIELDSRRTQKIVYPKAFDRKKFTS